ncbi:MAG: GNAT family N-acetyltransferase [Rhizobiales bacterium 32-66-8]|nr:MAG: GNAT family N-acetyltransferase [Rhizobiales bacterium 32-66-8]
MSSGKSAAPAPGLRPYLASDAPVLAGIFRAAIEDLTGEDYSPDQQEAWAAAADDDTAFAARLDGQLTLVATLSGQPVGFIALKDDKLIDLLYVHPAAIGKGVATLLCGAAETLAKARGTSVLIVDASDTALGFFQKRGFEAQRRNTVSVGPVWFGNTTLTKRLAEEKTLQ